MTVADVLQQLEALGSASVREHNSKFGFEGDQFGVKMGDIRAVAKAIKTDHELGLALWRTGNVDARFVGTLLLKPKMLTVDAVEQLVDDATYSRLADWLNTNVIKLHPEKESLRQRWMHSTEEMRSRAGWSLTAERIIKNPDGLDLSRLLDRIESEMPVAPYNAQWTMNYCLAEIGIRFPEYRERAIAIGERLGIFRDYPTSKGCTSPFAPIWITEMVSRQA
jgi:3-methyladenine DNA glycosylase AlkD